MNSAQLLLLLLRYEADVNATGEVLHAIRRPEKSTVRNFSVLCQLGDTALHAAARAGNRRLAELIIEHGGDVNIADFVRVRTVWNGVV